MLDKRRKIVLVCLYAAILFLVARMFYLQVLADDELAKSASNQRIIELTVDKPRGNIIDRNGIPFTNRERKILVAIKTLLLRGQDDEIAKISSILGLNPNKLKREIDIKKEPIIIEIDEEKRMQLFSAEVKGISLIYSLKRYGEGSAARHIIGYLNKADQTGAAGLEKSYENELKCVPDNYIGVVTDAANNLLHGLGYRLFTHESENSRLNLKLTLDYHIQKIVENVMDKNGISGAVVVEDVNNGDIVAMASKPDFDQNRVDMFLSSTGKELFNKAVASYNMGSIFKIIDAAAALEDGQEIGNNFFCPGYIKVGDKEFKCTSYKKGGHGYLDFTRAFALSCNPYFIDLGIRCGHHSIVSMAKKFGLGSPTGIKDQGINESVGSLPEEGKHFSDGDIANLSIGQGEVMVTPVQVADLVATIANGGIKNRVNIVDGIVDDKGNRVRNIKREEGQRIISKETADIIKEMMEEVVASGTGTRANLNEYGGSAGKTGSAETGLSIDGSTNVVQAWFAGYFPQKEPKYSIAVFVENGRVGGEAAAPIFEEIAREILIKGY